jgi:hypothetical protein
MKRVRPHFGGGGGWSEGTAFRRCIFSVLGFLARFGVRVAFLALVWIWVRDSPVHFLMQFPPITPLCGYCTSLFSLY